LIKVRDLDFSYGSVPILSGVGFDIAPGEFTGVIGPNGGGKTTLLRLILGLIEPVRGSITIDGRPVRTARSLIGYVPQTVNVDYGFPIPVRETVAMGLMTGVSFFPGFTRAEWVKVAEALDVTGIAGIADRRYGELSGGQRQRVLIARAIVSHPKILLMDEPTAQIDASAELSIMELLSLLNSQGITILLVSHDIGFIVNYVKKIVSVNRGACVHQPENLSLEEIMSQMYHCTVHGRKE